MALGSSPEIPLICVDPAADVTALLERHGAQMSPEKHAAYIRFLLRVVRQGFREARERVADGVGDPGMDYSRTIEAPTLSPEFLRYGAARPGVTGQTGQLSGALDDPSRSVARAADRGAGVLDPLPDPRSASGFASWWLRRESVASALRPAGGGSRYGLRCGAWWSGVWRLRRRVCRSRWRRRPGGCGRLWWAKWPST